mgnify:CR=1 FL=1
MLDTKGCRGQLMNIAQRLLSIDSPSGFTDQVVREVEQIARDHGYAVRRTNKGNLVVSVPGREKGKRVGLCAHIDTLGLMVRSITADGMLMTTRISGPILPTLDGEYCRIHTRDGRIYTGTILSLSPAAHVFDDVLTRPRDEKNLAVRIDEVVEDRAGVEALGIAPGDFVCIDPKTVVTDSGFLKSRFIDDKGSAACLLTLLRLMHIAGQRPRYDTEVCFTVHEEVGHGGATLPQAAGGGHGLRGGRSELHRAPGVHLRQGQRRPLRLWHGHPPGGAGPGQRHPLRGGHLPPLLL